MKAHQILKSAIASLIFTTIISACNDDDITTYQKNIGEPEEASKITSSSAVLECKIWVNRPITECGFEYACVYSAEDSLQYVNSEIDFYPTRIYTQMADGDSIITTRVDNLPENTLIIYRAFIYDKGTNKYSKPMCFRTKKFSLTVTTMNATQIGISKTRLNGKFDSNDINRIFNYGFIISTNKKDVQNCNSYNWYSSLDTYQGTYYCDVDYLLPNTTYYYRAILSYYDNDGNTLNKNGDVYNFTTKSPNSNQLKTGDYMLIRKTAVKLDGEVSADYDGYGSIQFIISSTKNSFTANDIDNPDQETKISYASYHEDEDFKSETRKFSTGFNGLTPNTTYYYAICFCMMNDEYFIGETKSFTTGTYNITCQDAANITAHSVILTGACDEENISCYESGFYLSSTSKEPTSENHETYDTKYGQNTSSHIDINAHVTGLKSNTTYYYRPYIYCDDQRIYGETKSFTTADAINIDGAVDLGGDVLWATSNLGATESNIVGDYYSWGSTSAQSSFFLPDYKIPTIDNIAGTQYDVATAILGKGWRMPTIQDLNEIILYCETSSATKNGMSGYMLTSTVTGQSIFVPCANIKADDMEQISYSANFWIGEKYGSTQAYSAEIGYSYTTVTFAHFGLPIRPVYDPTIK